MEISGERRGWRGPRQPGRPSCAARLASRESTLTDSANDVLRGTLDLIILKTLSLEPMHGWGISQRIQELSRGVLDVNQGSLYPALQRLEHRGWINSRWDTTVNNRRARYYSLTGDGRRGLEQEAASWARYSAAVQWIMETTTKPLPGTS